MEATAYSMLTPDDRLDTLYQCAVVEVGPESGPVVSVTYPDDLPEQLSANDRPLPVKTLVDGQALPLNRRVGGNGSLHILLGDRDDQELLKQMGENGAEDYQRIRPDCPELARTASVEGLTELAGDTIADRQIRNEGQEPFEELVPPGA